MTNAEVVKRFMMLKTKYAENKYWNHVIETENDCCSVTNTGCGSGFTCNEFQLSSQCHAFAMYMAKLVFNSYPNLNDISGNLNGYPMGDWKVYTSGNYSGLTLEPGDIIKTSDHTAIVWTISGDNVHVAEVWGSKNCVIKWEHFNGGELVTQSQILNAATYIVKAPKTTATETTVTTTFNPQGGTLSSTSKTYIPGKVYCMQPTPTKSGYHFTGWWPESSSYSQEYVPERNVPAYAHNLYAHWGKRYRVKNVGTGTYLSVTGANAIDLGNGMGISLKSSFSSSDLGQMWLFDNTTTTKQPIKSAVNKEYGIKYLKNGLTISSTEQEHIPVIHRTFQNESDSLLSIMPVGENTGEYYIIKNDGGTNLALTYSTELSSLIWRALSPSILSYQKWTLTEV